MDALRSKCSGGKTPLRLAAWMFLVVLGACAGSSGDDATAASSENLGTPKVDIEMSADELRTVYSTWINQLGLVQDDPIIWHTRLVEACTEGVWDPEVALSLADRYMSEDASLTADPDASSKGPTTEEAANALWTMAVQSCRERFPEAALKEGPPFMAPAEP